MMTIDSLESRLEAISKVVTRKEGSLKGFFFPDRNPYWRESIAHTLQLILREEGLAFAEEIQGPVFSKYRVSTFRTEAGEELLTQAVDGFGQLTDDKIRAIKRHKDEGKYTVFPGTFTLRTNRHLQTNVQAAASYVLRKKGLSLAEELMHNACVDEMGTTFFLLGSPSLLETFTEGYGILTSEKIEAIHQHKTEGKLRRFPGVFFESSNTHKIANGRKVVEYILAKEECSLPEEITRPTFVKYELTTFNQRNRVLLGQAYEDYGILTADKMKVVKRHIEEDKYREFPEIFFSDGNRHQMDNVKAVVHAILQAKGLTLPEELEKKDYEEQRLGLRSHPRGRKLIQAAIPDYGLLTPEKASAIHQHKREGKYQWSPSVFFKRSNRYLLENVRTATALGLQRFGLSFPEELIRPHYDAVGVSPLSNVKHVASLEEAIAGYGELTEEKIEAVRQHKEEGKYQRFPEVFFSPENKRRTSNIKTALNYVVRKSGLTFVEEIAHHHFNASGMTMFYESRGNVIPEVIEDYGRLTVEKIEAIQQHIAEQKLFRFRRMFFLDDNKYRDANVKAVREYIIDKHNLASSAEITPELLQREFKFTNFYPSFQELVLGIRPGEGLRNLSRLTSLPEHEWTKGEEELLREKYERMNQGDIRKEVAEGMINEQFGVSALAVLDKLCRMGLLQPISSPLSAQERELAQARDYSISFPALLHHASSFLAYVRETSEQLRNIAPLLCTAAAMYPSAARNAQGNPEFANVLLPIEFQTNDLVDYNLGEQRLLHAVMKQLLGKDLEDHDYEKFGLIKVTDPVMPTQYTLLYVRNRLRAKQDFQGGIIDIASASLFQFPRQGILREKVLSDTDCNGGMTLEEYRGCAEGIARVPLERIQVMNMDCCTITYKNTH